MSEQPTATIPLAYLQRLMRLEMEYDMGLLLRAPGAGPTGILGSPTEAAAEKQPVGPVLDMRKPDALLNLDGFGFDPAEYEVTGPKIAPASPVTEPDA